MIELECLPHGVGHAGEGICLTLVLGRHRVLLDCGLRDLGPLLDGRSPGDRDGKGTGPPAAASPGDCPNPSQRPADWVVCSHAHDDHARGLLSLHRAFPDLPILASETTARLLPLNWPGADPAEARAVCQGLPWRSPVALADDLSVTLYPAGHLPGAALTLLTYQPSARDPSPHEYRSGSTDNRTYRVAYTGDFFLSNARLVEGLRLDEVRGLKPDVLVVEGSYGTARHPRRRAQENALAERIAQALACQQSVLCPVPPLGLGQELLMLLRSHHYFTGRDFTLWVDGQVAAGCDAYLDLLANSTAGPDEGRDGDESPPGKAAAGPDLSPVESCFPSAVQNFARHQNLFWDDRVRPPMRRLSPADLETLGDRPSIVLVDDNADLSRYCRRGAWLVLWPEGTGERATATRWPAEGSGRRLPQGAERLRGREGAPGENRAIAETYLLAEHCDASGTLQLVHNLRPQHVVFVHGSPERLADLTNLGELNSRYQLHCPKAGKRVRLPIGQMFLQPAAPAERFEGEVADADDGALVALPEAIVRSDRWAAFAETGVVEARWQGKDLVLRGLSQRELLDRDDGWVAPDTLCCQTCRHYGGPHGGSSPERDAPLETLRDRGGLPPENRYCWNPASPLAGRQVDPDGCCPAFEPRSQPPPAE